MKTMISIVLPVYNRFSGLINGIGELKTMLKQRPCTYEIIIVDDGAVNMYQIKAIADFHKCNYLRNYPDAGKGKAVKKLIVITPKQRYYYYTLDEHVIFFPRKEILTALLDMPEHICRLIDGDWVYIGFPAAIQSY